MKLFKYIAMILLAGLFAACTDDLIDDPRQSHWQGDGTEALAIAVKCDDLIPIDMNKSRATGIPVLSTVLSKVNDLNVRVHLKQPLSLPADDPLYAALNGKSYVTFFCTPLDLTYTIYINGVGVNDDYADPKVDPVYVNRVSDPEAVSILHCGKHITAANVSKIEVIANYGKDLWNDAATGAWNTLKETGADAPGRDYCMMYGVVDATQATPESGSHIDNMNKCKKFTVQLTRSRALLTVKVVNAGLNEGVFIMPTKARLCNVPTECNLSLLNHADGKPGNVLTDKAKVVKISQEHEVHNGNIGESGVQFVGNHLEEGMTEIPPQFTAMYLFENMQGVSRNNSGAIESNHSTHWQKYPDGITTVKDAKDFNKNYKYSYLEIEAKYTQKKYGKLSNGERDPQDPGVVMVSGTIIYRFFLGENATNNFNIQGNHYYKLTLNLKGFGGPKEDGNVVDGKLVVDNPNDASWRVDTEFKNWGFEKSEYDLDSHYIDASARVIGTGENWRFSNVKVGRGDESWLVLNVETSTGNEWANPTQIAGGKDLNGQPILLKIQNGYLRYQVQPMTYVKNGNLDPSGQFDENTFKLKKNYREMKFDVTKVDGSGNPVGTPQTITVRQYAPIPINDGQHTFFIERFEEYYPDHIGYPWGYQGDKNLAGLHDENQNSASFVFGQQVSGDQVSLNTVALSYDREDDNHWIPNPDYGKPVPPGHPRQPDMIMDYTPQWELDKGGYGTAAHACYRKGKPKFQGSPAMYYALPTQKMFQAIREYKHRPEWGPFEYVHEEDDYWTSTVLKKGTATTVIYNGTALDNGFIESSDRTKNLRVRAAYIPFYIKVPAPTY